MRDSPANDRKFKVMGLMRVNLFNWFIFWLKGKEKYYHLEPPPITLLFLGYSLNQL